LKLIGGKVEILRKHLLGGFLEMPHAVYTMVIVKTKENAVGYSLFRMEDLYGIVSIVAILLVLY
jgi:hypothetical protein